MRLLFLLLIPCAALAQVTTNEKALEQLGPAKPPAQNAPPRTAHRGRTTAHRAAPARPVAQPPAVAAAPPANPVILPPPFTMPAHKPPPPPPVPVKPDAVGTAAALPGNGLRITFGPGSSDLNPATQAALQQVAAAALARPDMQIDITAWAPGAADDPSTPRRLSLDRALAARAVLLNAGLVSDRIQALAKGFTDIGSAPPDRADIAEILPPPPKPPPIQPPPAPAGAPKSH